jgi:hypothetical protein
MKKFENLGKSLSKTEQKKIVGGVEDPPGGGFCNGDGDVCGEPNDPPCCQTDKNLKCVSGHCA